MTQFPALAYTGVTVEVFIGTENSRFPFFPIQVCYRKDRHMQNSMRKKRKLKLTLTLVLTLTDTGGAVLTLMLGYRSLYITWQ